MAGTQEVDDERLYLGKVVATGKVLGTGSFGSVIEVKYKSLLCAAKQLHEIFLEPENNGIQRLIQNYRRECHLMASLRHPNITQFLGLCFIKDAQLPLILMERLEMNVADLLDNVPNLPLSNKLSILHDTCCGLVYLHGIETPIVHRDLTARNVLLTSSLTAKISDLGNSRFINQRSSYLAASMSRCPGTMVYMPPEALNGVNKYGPSLDVFSFGHLALYILIQEFPCNLLAATYPDPQDGSRIRGRLEQERRGAYLTKLKRQFVQSHPVLIKMVRQCLRNMPDGRPLSVELMSTLEEVKAKAEGMYGVAAVNTANILVTKEMAMKENKIKELQTSLENSAVIRQRLENDKQRLQNEKGQIQSENQSLQTEKLQLQSEKLQLYSENRLLQAEKHTLQEDIQHLQDEQQKLPDEFVEGYVNMEDQLERCIELLRESEQDREELEADLDCQQTKVNDLEGEKQKLQNDVVILRRDLEKRSQEILQCYQAKGNQLLDKESEHRAAKTQEAPKAEQLFSRSASWNRSGNENEIEGSRRSYPALGPLGHIHVNEIESEDELFPSSFKSDRKPLIEKVEENIKKDSSRSPKPSCGLFGPGDDDDDYDISFITSKRIPPSKPVSSGGGLFGSDDEDDDDMFFTPSNIASKPTPVSATPTDIQSITKDDKTASAAVFGDVDAVSTDTDNLITSAASEKTTWELVTIKNKLEELSEEEEDEEEGEHVKEVKEMKQDDKKVFSKLVSLFNSDNEDEDDLFFKPTKSATKPASTSSTTAMTTANQTYYPPSSTTIALPTVSQTYYRPTSLSESPSVTSHFSVAAFGDKDMVATDKDNLLAGAASEKEYAGKDDKKDGLSHSLFCDDDDDDDLDWLS